MAQPQPVPLYGASEHPLPWRRQREPEERILDKWQRWQECSRHYDEVLFHKKQGPSIEEEELDDPGEEPDWEKSEQPIEQQLLSRRQYKRWCKGLKMWDDTHCDPEEKCYVFPVADPDIFALYQQLIYTGKTPRDPTLAAPKITEQGFDNEDDDRPKKPCVRCGDKHLCGQEYQRLASLHPRL
ncbi:hypothetical protein E8E11_004859 [Didymella keratinophila]|nr:hypothetical protein E8E11_004859 [Didymella keratinophila]